MKTNKFAHVCMIVSNLANCNAMTDKTPLTPTKSYSRKGRKPKAASVDDYCRLCKCSLKNKYGSVGSFVNMFKPTNRAELKGLIVASVCEQSGIRLKENPTLSTRICPSCSRKVKTFTGLHTFLSSEISRPGPETTASTQDTSTKRLVQLTPGKSPSRKFRRISAEEGSVETSHQVRPPLSRRRILTTFCDQENDDNVLTNLNVEDIVESETTRVKVLILSPNGDIKVTTPRDKITTGVVKNLALKNWKAAANAFISHKDAVPELLEALNRTVNREFKAFCKLETVLKGRNPDELVAFSNKLLAKEVEVYLLFWNACVCGSCGEKIDSCQDAVNAIALTTATVARRRRNDLSAFHYSVSTILCHSGVSFDGVVFAE